MGWIHDTGYAPAYRHEGYPASVRADGSDVGGSSAEIGPSIIGWRSACDCGWRGQHLYPRAEWPSPTGSPPDAVDGWETGTATFAEWTLHLHTVLPELAVHDLVQVIREATADLPEAVRVARAAGTSWNRIADAAGVTSRWAEQQWGSPERHSRPTPRAAPGDRVAPTRHGHPRSHDLGR